jgi:hypothetical protein
MAGVCCLFAACCWLETHYFYRGLLLFLGYLKGGVAKKHAGDCCLWISVCRVFVGLASTSFAYLTSVRDTHKIFYCYGTSKMVLTKFFMIILANLPGKAVKKASRGSDL